MRLLIVAALLGLCLGGCKEASTSGYQQHNLDLNAHLAKVGLGPGDVFEVTVYGEKALSGLHSISPEGTIDFPFVGQINVADRTPNEITTLLRERLRAGYLRDPFVSVLVRKYSSKKVFVLGKVQKPGTFPYAAGMTVVEAIALAGGFLSTANPNYVVVTRKGRDGNDKRIPVPVGKISEGLASNLELVTGDIVFVPDRLL